jgi:hypothetical protein
MLQASPRVLHFKCILDFDEGQGTHDEMNDQFAHRRIVAEREILRNHGRNDNSPAPGTFDGTKAAGYIEGALRARMVVDFEPTVSIGGQGYYLEDMYLINKTGAELLTPGVPNTAEEIERFLARK